MSSDAAVVVDPQQTDRPVERLPAADQSLTTPITRALPIVAIAREDFAPAQARMVELADARIREWVEQRDELSENVEVAKRNKWRHQPLVRAHRMAVRMVTYYECIRAALVAGYMVMPDLQCDVYAVRVSPTGRMPATLVQTNWRPRDPRQTADSLSVGAGEYVSDVVVTDRRVDAWKDASGAERKTYTHKAVAELPPEAPLILARPVLLEAAERAMALRIFDEIGIVGANRRSRSADPMLVGRINDPRPTRRGQAFFIAWWFEPRSL